jgi:putative ABC transport system substrate-binding protein
MIAGRFLLLLALLAAPLVAQAQPGGKIPRMGQLYFGVSPSSPADIAKSPFWRVMNERGWVERQTIVVERRYGDSPEQVQANAAELVRLKVDVIFAPTSLATQAAYNATHSIPIVAWSIADPVGLGVTQSLGRPSSNVTGVTTIASDLWAKRFELLKTVLPQVIRVAVLGNPDNPMHPLHLKATRAAAKYFGLDLRVFEVRRPGDLDGAFTAMTRERVGALFVLPDPMLFVERDQLARRAVIHRMPAMFEFREFTEAGALMSYGANIADTLRSAAAMVDKILNGAKPSEIPFEQPTKFDLVINLKTAKTLGLTIPPSLLLRADEVIQ